MQDGWWDWLSYNAAKNHFLISHLLPNFTQHHPFFPKCDLLFENQALSQDIFCQKVRNLRKWHSKNLTNWSNIYTHTLDLLCKIWWKIDIFYAKKTWEAVKVAILSRSDHSSTCQLGTVQERPKRWES